MRVPDDMSNQRCSIARLKSSAVHNDLLVLFCGPDQRTEEAPMRDGAG
jgi:hypothetical protein